MYNSTDFYKRKVSPVYKQQLTNKEQKLLDYFKMSK